jgi:catechol 2,3-dioxygenase-like lactoylglutathione lyase family enzyme
VSRATVEAYFASINADSFADLAKVFTPDMEIHTVGTRPVVGREGALAHFPRFLARFTEHDDQVSRWIETPDAIVTEILFEDRLTSGRPNGRFQYRTTRGDQMRFGKVSHIAIGVSDMAKSRHFYRDILGMRVTLDDPYENPDGKLPDTVGDERGQSRHAVYLRWEEEDAPDSSFIVLTQYGDARGSGVALDDIGISHVSFWVDDVDAVYRRVVAHGVDVMVKPHIGDTVSYGEAPGGKIKTILFRDPDGTILQVDERLPT